MNAITPMNANIPERFRNLDCIDQDSLRFLAYEIIGNGVRPIRGARLLFPSCPKGYVAATCKIHHYAINKLTAMACRLRGDISAALEYEDTCERIYKDLPKYAKW